MDRKEKYIFLFSNSEVDTKRAFFSLCQTDHATFACFDGIQQSNGMNKVVGLHFIIESMLQKLQIFSYISQKQDKKKIKNHVITRLNSMFIAKRYFGFWLQYSSRVYTSTQRWANPTALPTYFYNVLFWFFFISVLLFCSVMEYKCALSRQSGIGLTTD